MSVSFVLENLYEIDELHFTFEIGFLLILSWEDDRIQARGNLPRSRRDDLGDLP